MSSRRRVNPEILRKGDRFILILHNKIILWEVLESNAKGSPKGLITRMEYFTIENNEVKITNTFISHTAMRTSVLGKYSIRYGLANLTMLFNHIFDA